MNIRPSNETDIAALQTVLDETELFPSGMLPDMIAEFLNAQDATEIWLTCETNGAIAGFCYAIPEALTDGTWNMRAIAVLPALQGNGVGAALTKQLEADLSARAQRVLIVDTSSDAGFDKTRAFYRNNGFTQEARIRDFWAAGEDKIIFWKALA